jgi:hypothetical protein
LKGRGEMVPKPHTGHPSISAEVTEAAQGRVHRRHERTELLIR